MIYHYVKSNINFYVLDKKPEFNIFHHNELILDLNYKSFEATNPSTSTGTEIKSSDGKKYKLIKKELKNSEFQKLNANKITNMELNEIENIAILEEEEPVDENIAILEE
jgi:hypothetical protein